MKSASPAAQLTVRSMNTLFETKEQGEEARYIHQKEAERQAQLKAELDRILALEDHHEEKQELHDLIGINYYLFHKKYFCCSFLCIYTIVIILLNFLGQLI